MHPRVTCIQDQHKFVLISFLKDTGLGIDLVEVGVCEYDQNNL